MRKNPFIHKKHILNKFYLDNLRVVNNLGDLPLLDEIRNWLYTEEAEKVFHELTVIV